MRLTYIFISNFKFQAVGYYDMTYFSFTGLVINISHISFVGIINVE